jgi:hypothetical protein
MIVDGGNICLGAGTNISNFGPVKPLCGEYRSGGIEEAGSR